MRMERDSAVLKVFKTVPFGQQPTGRPKRGGSTVWTPILALRLKIGVPWPKGEQPG